MRDLGALEAEYDLRGQWVLLRLDLNMPMDEAGQVTDRTRLTASLPTLRHLRKAGAHLLICSHFGRPKGKADARWSLAPIAPLIAQALGETVQFVPDCVGEAVSQAKQTGEVLLLENLRFHAGEEANDDAFAQKLAEQADFYVNDAFSVCHRAHASTEAVAHLLPAAAGLALKAEVAALEAALEKPQRPVMAVIGGAKVSTKLAVLENLLEKVDILALGGGMANTFLAAEGAEIGQSLQEPDLHDTARTIIRKAKESGCRLILPQDYATAARFDDPAPPQHYRRDTMPPDRLILDLGAHSIDEMCHAMQQAKTLLWNGPMGVFEKPPYDAGTTALARAAAELTASGALKSIGGGGDTVAALVHAGVLDSFTHISTAGGAFLEWLEGRTLPGILALQNSE